MSLLDRIRDRIIADWRRHWSVWLSGASATFYAMLTIFPDQALSLWNGLPEAVRNSVPHGSELSAILFGLVLLVRVIKQGKADVGPKQ